MKILVAPDSFKGALSAREACGAIASGVRRAAPEAEVRCVPMADGGEGTVDALVAARAGTMHTASLSTPGETRASDSRRAEWGDLGDGLAVVESASAVGLDVVARSSTDVLDSSTRPLGELILAVLDAGFRRILVTLGGTGTNDGGAGMLAEFGARFLDDRGREVPPIPRRLGEVAYADLDALDARLDDVQFTMASDVSNPLLGEQGATAVYGPQKGVRLSEVPAVDDALSAYADAVEAAAGRRLRDLPGTGAAGGIGFALTLLGAVFRPGVEVVADAVRLKESLVGVDLVLTGEGSVDVQTLSGKTPAGVADAAYKVDPSIPVVVLAGTVASNVEFSNAHPSIRAVFPIGRAPRSLDAAIAATAQDLEETAFAVTRLVMSRGGGDMRAGREVSASVDAVPLSGIDHAAVITTDYERSKSFYVGVLGLRLESEHFQERGTWKGDLRIPGGGYVELFEFRGAPPRVDRPEAQGLRHLAFRTASVEGCRSALMAAGVACESMRIDPYTGDPFFFTRDPDGLPIEFYERSSG